MVSSELISVVVPVYNVEKYLDKCVESIVNQTYKNLEIILVDDGSPDNCPKMCDEWAEKENRVITIHKENGGLSSARNIGIDSSSGKFLLFVDSDDYLDLSCIEKLYKCICNNKTKIAVGRYRNIINNKPSYDIRFTNSIRTLVKTNYWDEYFDYMFKYDYDNSSPYITAWGKLFSSDLFENIRFPLNKLHEDDFTTFELIDKCETITFMDMPLYNYRRRNDSIMGTRSKKSYYDAMEAFQMRHDFFINDYSYSRIHSKSYMLLLNTYIDFYFKLKREYGDYYNDIKKKYNDNYLSLKCNTCYNTLKISSKILFASFYINDYLFKLARKILNSMGNIL